MTPACSKRPTNVAPRHLDFRSPGERRRGRRGSPLRGAAGGSSLELATKLAAADLPHGFRPAWGPGVSRRRATGLVENRKAAASSSDRCSRYCGTMAEDVPGTSEATDFRSSRMDSPEGRGIARARWEASPEGQLRTTPGDPSLGRFARWVAAPTALDLAGFWVMWHLRGGFEGLRQMGLSRSSIYRRVSTFRRATGMHPDEFVFPGISLDLTAYQEREIPD